MSCSRDNADNLNCLVWLCLATQVVAHAHTVVAAALRARRVIACELNSLTERNGIRPKFLRQDFVYDRNQWTVGLSGFGGIKRSSAQDWQSNRTEIVRAYAVPRSVKGETFRGGGWLLIWSGTNASALHIFA